MKKLRLGLSLLGCISLILPLFSFAEDSTGSLPLPINENSIISVPLLPSSFSVTAGAIYLETLDNNLNFQTLTLSSPPVIDLLRDRPRAIDKEYNWGFLVGAEHVFPDSGNDLHFDWTHLDTGTLLGPLVINQVSVAGATTTAISNGQASLDSDFVNLQFGQFFDIGCRLRSNLYGGIRYANFDRDFSTNGSLIVTTAASRAAISDEISTTSRFQGVGPLAGLHSSFELFKGFHFVTDFSSALLVGDSSTNGQEQFSVEITGDPTLFFLTRTPTISPLRVVPAVDAKLGLDYNYNFSTGFGVILAAGYQVDHYFHVLERRNPDAADALIFHVANLPAFTPFPLGTGKTSDLAFQGPYINLTLVMP